MASGVIYTASWSADKWVDWLASERRRKRRRNELDSLLLLILRYFLWKWERLPQTNPQQDISFGLGIHQSLEAENWSSSQQLNGTPAFFLSSRRKENINCHSLTHDVHHCAVFTFVHSAAKLMSASIFFFWTMHLPSKQKPPPCRLFWGCLWIFRSWLERTWQRSSALTEIAVDHRKWHGGCPSRPLAEWATQLKVDCGGSRGGAFPRPAPPRPESSSGEPGVLIALIWSSADNLLQFTDWRWLNAWLDPMITSYHMHAQISLTNTHSHPQCSRCLFSPIQCLSPRVCVPTSVEFSNGNLLWLEAILMIANKAQKTYRRESSLWSKGIWPKISDTQKLVGHH